MDLTDRREIQALLRRTGFRFTRALGQNFLCDAEIPEQVVRAADVDGETGVLEVGPGAGCLTLALSHRAKRVLAVEKDRALRPVLAETLGTRENVSLLFCDILQTDLAALRREYLGECERAVVCANLPYQISTPFLSRLAGAGCFQRAAVMVQREVARRICARENTPEYGAFSVLMQWYMIPRLLFDVGPSSFYPRPNVVSSVIRMDRRERRPRPVLDEAEMFRLVRAAFGQRRKTLCNAMANGLGLTRDQAAAALQACGFDPMIRGEALSPVEFAALSDALTERKETGP